MTWWETVLADFREVLEVDAQPNLWNAHSLTPSGLDVALLPNSIYNGAYSIAFEGFTGVGREVNTSYDFQGRVRIRVGYIINSEAVADPNGSDTTPINAKTDYSHAVEDIELIIKTRLNVETYHGVLDYVNFISCSPLQFLNETENYAICDIVFEVGRQTT